jgi:cullin-associated NEDD8-dissociated protein 1
MEAAKIRELLKQTSHHDKDERFMAISDLSEELDKVDGRLDSSLQVPIRDAIMKRLEDASNDVQTQACNCLSAIVKKFEVKHVDSIVEKLGDLLVSGTMEQRDIYTIALKNILSSVHDDFGSQISRTLVDQLLKGLKMRMTKGDTEEETQEHTRNYYNRVVACLDISRDLCERFGFVMTRDAHQSLADTIMPMLNDKNGDIRKKVVHTLGGMVSVVDDRLFEMLMSRIIDQIKSMTREDATLFTYIQAISVFSRNGGKRVAPFLKDIVPLLLEICGDEALEEPTEVHIELRENCLQAFETLIQQCPKEIDEYSDKLLEIALTLMKFDPLYSYGDDVAMADADGDEAEAGDDDGFGDDDEWGDDGDGWGEEAAMEVVVMDAGDDTTWKVRRSSIKVITAFIVTHKRKITEHQLRLAEELLGQFREHDSTVKLELFTTFRELLLATIVADAGLSTAPITSLEAPSLVRQKSDFHIIAQKLDEIMEKVIAELRRPGASVAVKSGLLGIVRDLVVVRQAERSVNCDVLPAEGLAPYFKALIPQIVQCVKNSDTQLKHQGLYVLYLILSLHSSIDGLNVVEMIHKSVTEAVAHDYSRVKAQALMTAAKIFTCIRPLRRRAGDIADEVKEDDIKAYDSSKYDPVVRALFAVSFKQLELKDVEQEVKKSALNAVAVGIAHFGDVLSTETPTVLGILQDRLDREVTTVAALKAVATISRSSLEIDLSSLADSLVADMIKFLRKASQSLKTTAASAFTALYSSPSAVKAISAKNTDDLISQAASFIVDTDLQLCHLVLDMVSQIMSVQAGACKIVGSSIFPNVYTLLESPLIQGQALVALRNMVAVFQRESKGAILKYTAIKDSLIKTAKKDLNRQSYVAIAQCMATLTLGADEATRGDAVKQLIALLDDKNEAHVQVALLSLGEIGRSMDLYGFAKIDERIQGGLSHESESVKWAASFALGNVAVGNLAKFVPVLLGMIGDSKGRQYLLLNSLKEVIDYHSATEELRAALLPFSSTISPLLFGNAKDKDEGTRGMVAECLGRFAIIDASVYDIIQKELENKDVNIRSTMAASLKYALNPAYNTALPESVLVPFLELLKDSDLGVKRACFLTIVSILHVNYRLIMSPLSTRILPVIFKHTETDLSLIREMDLGPFKHKVDDGLPLRKAAFQCMDTLIDACPNLLDLHDYLAHLKNGFTDENNDIQMITYQILYRLGRYHGAAVVSALDELPTALMAGIKQKMKAMKNEKEAERATDIMRACLKALFTLQKIQNISKAPKFVTFVTRVEKTKSLVEVIAEVQAKLH